MPYIDPRMSYMWDEYNAGKRNIFRWLGKPIGKRQYVEVDLGEELLSAGIIESFKWKSDDRGVRAKYFRVNAAPRKLVVNVLIDSLPEPFWNSIGDLTQYVLANHIRITSSILPIKAVSDEQFRISFTGYSENAYKGVDPKYGNIPLSVLFCLEVNGKQGKPSWVYLDPEKSEKMITIISPDNGRPRLVILCGAEQGKIILENLSLRRGCAEIMFRRFERGLVLMNGSNSQTIMFDLQKIDPNAAYKRIDGVIDPVWNNGKKEGPGVKLPPFEALFLEKIGKQ